MPNPVPATPARRRAPPPAACPRARPLWLASLALHGALLSALSLPRGASPPPPGPLAIALAWAPPGEQDGGAEPVPEAAEAPPAPEPLAEPPPPGPPVVVAPPPPPPAPAGPERLALAPAPPPLPDEPAPLAPAATEAAPPAPPPPAPLQAASMAVPPAPRPAAPRPAPPREAARPAPRPAGPHAPASPVAATPVAAGPAGTAAPAPSEALSAALLPDSYRAALGARLRQALRYPPSARERDEEGDAILAFRVARDGTIRGAQLMRSSGVAALDQEALALLARISPAPALPESWPAAEAAFVVPVRFRLR